MNPLAKAFPLISNTENYGSIELTVWRQSCFSDGPFVIEEPLIQEVEL